MVRAMGFGCVAIGIDGTPSEVFVYQDLSPDLDDEAVRTVRQWRFTPGKGNGQAVAGQAL
jgi:outer membrane biosynthesis protein TonB